MPSPFPGMDPYLEGSTWMNFHGQLCSEIARQLGPKLRPRYLARLTERFFTEIAVAAGSAKPSEFPDVAVVESMPLSQPNGAGGLGVATVPVRVPTEIPESILHFSVEIRDRLERRLVTSIEVLSPTNKRDEYLAILRRSNPPQSIPPHRDRPAPLGTAHSHDAGPPTGSLLCLRRSLRNPAGD